MKKSSIITFALAVIMAAGCTESENKTVYVKGIYDAYSEIAVPEDNGLYKFINDTKNELNGKYSKQDEMEVDDEKACADFNKAVEDLGKLKEEFDAKIASGADFGPGHFKIGYQYKVLREIKEIKVSEVFDFSYKTNTRLDSSESVEIDTRNDQSKRGFKDILLSKGESHVTVTGFQLYNSDGTVSNAELIRNVDPSVTGGNTYFKVEYFGEQGKNAGDYYVLVTFYDNNDTAKTPFDFKIPVTHITTE